MKKIAAMVAGLGLVFALGACGSADEPVKADDNYVGVCTDPDTGNRVDDSKCASAPQYVDNGFSAGDFFWAYMIANALTPSYGSHVTQYVTRIDDTRHNVYRGGVPASGGYVDFQKYKPVSSTVKRPNVSVKSDRYQYNYNKSPNYVRPKSSPAPKSSVKSGGGYGTKPKSGTYRGGSGGGGYKAPAPRPAGRR